MKFGICGSMVAKQPDSTGVDLVNTIKETGYHFIELSLSKIAELSDEEFINYKNKLLSSGIKAEVCTDLFPEDIKITGPKIIFEKISPYVNGVIQRAAELGAKTIVIGSGKSRLVPENFSLGVAWEQLVFILRFVDNVAKKFDITVVLDPLCKEECNIINNLSEAQKLILDINGQNIKLLFSYYHHIKENEQHDIIKELGQNIKHIHFAKVEGRKFPLNKNEDKNYHKIFENFRLINYDNTVSIEAYPTALELELKTGLLFLKKNFSKKKRFWLFSIFRK